MQSGLKSTVVDVGNNQESENRLRVLVCDDHPIIREAIAGVLDSSDHLEVVGAISNFEEGVDFVHNVEFDIAVVDVHLKGKSGLELVEHIRMVRPAVKVVMLTAFVSDELFFEANKIGVITVIDKNIETERIADLVLAASSGKTFDDDTLLKDVVSRLKDEGIISLLNLSKVDRHIVALVAEGRSDKEIGEMVYLSSQTVRNRISRILTVLGKSNRTQIALLLNKLDEVIQQRFTSQI